MNSISESLLLSTNLPPHREPPRRTAVLFMRSNGELAKKQAFLYSHETIISHYLCLFKRSASANAALEFDGLTTLSRRNLQPLVKNAEQPSVHTVHALNAEHTAAKTFSETLQRSRKRSPRQLQRLTATNYVQSPSRQNNRSSITV